ncbi:MAG TPA: malto-oligosyltrehalose synthase [Puia sp.]|jgi:(1->4)-alpha-D-glucan 1-alpha-D-glucosylmutase|nr:malto-oligosyltrehalose synthase [Puia sp.]
MSLPSSTYRIQLHAGFTFQRLEDILNYLQELGISTVYASPVTTATKGSQHGYDVTDALVLSPEIGTEQEWERLAGLLKKKGMDWLQDIVPNHMAFDSSNSWLYDVLERGKNSAYYRFFDIDTDHSTELLGDKIMVPFLGKTLTECLQGSELKLIFKCLAPSTGSDGSSCTDGFFIKYYDKEFPISTSSYTWICTIADGCPPALLFSLHDLEQAALQPVDISVTAWAVAKAKWIEQVRTKADWVSFLRQRVSFFNEQQALIGELLNNQHYVLTHGSLAASRINYRRFFTVNSLICLRMEDPIVFTAYHEKIRQWMQKGYLQGLRIDHIDGLAFPRPYIERLRNLFGKECYIVAEKILTGEELLPEDWPLQGTTGYDFLSMINQLMTDENGYRELQTFYQERIKDNTPYEEIIFAKKHNYLKTQMGGEWNNLVDLLLSLPLLAAEKMNKERLKEALGILMASFPVYRVYPELTGKGPGSSFPEASRHLIDNTFVIARKKTSSSSPELAFLESLFEESGDMEKNRQKKIFQARLMQFTGPLAAKGIEDTTFYTYNPLIARNEVGDSPGIMTMTPAEFHQKMVQRRQSLPHSMNATATHDTKRGEDSRIRLNWLTAHPLEWIEKVKKWSVINRALLTPEAPSSNDEYLIYQSLLGCFPMDLIVTDPFRERLHQYLTKALREAKTNTNWEAPNEAYEKKCQSFLNEILRPESAFLEDFIPFVFEVIRRSVPFCLSQVLVKLTAPGMPDIYQGSECWDLSLVDPDNRAPVDYALRKNLLSKIKEEEKKGASVVLNFTAAHQQQGAEKLFTIYKTLAYRNQYPQVFSAGDYIPVEAALPLLSYIRRYEADWVLVIFPLIRREIPIPETFSISLPPDAPSEWVNIFTGERLQSSGNAGYTLQCKGLLLKFPVAMLTNSTSA